MELYNASDYKKNLRILDLYYYLITITTINNQSDFFGLEVG